MNEDDLARQEHEHACASSVPPIFDSIELTPGKRAETNHRAPRDSENISCRNPAVGNVRNNGP